MRGGSGVLAPGPSESPSGARPVLPELGLRLLSAAILGPTALLCLWFGAVPWILLIGLGAVGLGAEWAVLAGQRPSSAAALALVGGLVLATLEGAVEHQGLAFGLLGSGGALAWWFARPSAHALRLAAGAFYIGLAMLALLWLRGDPGAAGSIGRANTLFLVLLVWASDSGAYVAGRAISGPKLAPAISPGKTWAGALGGLAATCLFGLAFAGFARTALPAASASLPHAAVIAGGLGLVAQAGDLLESAIKRHVGVKDSGWLIPGHGGLLDRLDALLAAAPVAALLSLWTGRGALLWS